MKKKTVDKIFMSIFGLIGIIIFALSTSAFKKIPKNCPSNLIQDGLTAINVISAVLTIMAICYMFCIWKKGDCYTDKSENEISEIYLYISAFISLIMLIILGAVGGKLKTGCKPTAAEKDKMSDLKFNVWAMFTIVLISLILSISGLWYISGYIPGQLKTAKITTAPKPEVPKGISDRLFIPLQRDLN